MDDEDQYESPYENGCWVWDDAHDRLKFKSNVKHVANVNKTIAPERIAGSLQFKEDFDLFEQLRFQNRFQRRTTKDHGVVTLQDVKDVTLFSAPRAILSKDIITILHRPLTERFLRAIIFYCQYYLQISEKMNQRSLETKIRTPKSDRIEMEFRENMEDLRLLVAKEYSSMILGADHFDRYHHMGRRKQISFTAKDAILFETLLRMTIHIVWIALGRKSKEAIEVEVNRLFKSDRFNFVEHKFKYQATMSTEEQALVLGHCLRRDTMLSTSSPLMNEVFCDRVIDTRMLSLGVVKYPNLSPRLKYLERVLILPEENLQTASIILGILGTPRKLFDTMLKEIVEKRSSQSTTSLFVMAKVSKSSTSVKVHKKLYEDIVLPERQSMEDLEDTFPSKLHSPKASNTKQRWKWIKRLQ